MIVSNVPKISEPQYNRKRCRRPDNDVSGTTLVGLLIAMGAEVVTRRIVTDDLETIKETLLEMSVRDDVNLVLTTGGTGFAARDNTPEATVAVIEREAPGIAEAIRRESAKATPMAMLSRGVPEFAEHLDHNFPGCKAVTEGFEVVSRTRQAVDLLSGESQHCM